MPRIETEVLINAPIQHVYRIAKDVERFPEFMADLQSLTVLERSPDDADTVSVWVGYLREFKITIKWTQRDHWDDAKYRDDYQQIKGDMERMEGYWQFHAEGDNQTRFESVLDYDYNVPLIGPMIKNLIKKKLTENLQATLNGIKARAESSLNG